MKCPKCGSTATPYASRTTDNETYRLYACKNKECYYVFGTRETVDPDVKINQRNYFKKVRGKYRTENTGATRIIRKGTPPVRFECECCDCIFECKKEAYETEVGYVLGTTGIFQKFVARCPMCDHCTSVIFIK